MSRVLKVARFRLSSQGRGADPGGGPRGPRIRPAQAWGEFVIALVLVGHTHTNGDLPYSSFPAVYRPLMDWPEAETSAGSGRKAVQWTLR